jgi:outer membrane lipoprotein SlyB
VKEKIVNYTLAGTLMMYVALLANSGYATQQYNADVQDHYKTVISQKPYNVEVCRDQMTSGDKTGDALTGAIIGGILGNNIKGEKDGGAIGAIIGGMLGHSNSGASGGVKTICSNQTRYKEESKRVYSHSSITFAYEGRAYTVNFKK